MSGWLLIVQQLQSVLVESLMGAELQLWVTAIGDHGLMDSKISPLLGAVRAPERVQMVQVVDLGSSAARAPWPPARSQVKCSTPLWVFYFGDRE